MRRIPFHLCLLALFLCFFPLATAQPLNPYVGSWVTEAGSLSRLEVSLDAGTPYLQLWGEVEGVAFSGEKVAAHSLWFNRYDESVLTPRQLSARLPLETGDATLTLALDAEAGGLQAQLELPGSGASHRIRLYREATSQLGSISGKALGPASSVSSIFRVALYGPDDGRRAVGVASFDEERSFSFDRLPDGVYWMYVESPGFSVVRSFPEETTIVIRNGQAYVQNIEMR